MSEEAAIGHQAPEVLAIQSRVLPGAAPSLAHHTLPCSERGHENLVLHVVGRI